MRVALGRVVGAHGVRGQLRVRYFGDGPENLLALASVALARPERGADDPAPQEFEVLEAGAGRAGEVRLALRGLADREAAQALRGRLVVADAAALAPLPEGEHYWYQLVGCRVETTGGREVGTVRELWETGAHDVLVVEDADGQRCLIPTAPALLREVDAAGRRIVVEDLPGLFDPI